MVGLVCSTIGVFMVLRRLSFIADGLAHITFGGIALGLFLRTDLLSAPLAVAILSALGIRKVAKKGRLSGDVAIGLFYTSGLAAGILILGFVKGHTVDILSYLFGSILTVTETDLGVTFVAGTVVFLAIGFLYKELVYITFDEESARASGLPVEKLDYMIMILTAIIVVMAMKIVGILLVSALIIIPAAASLQLSRNFKETLILANIFGVTSTTIGVIASYYLNVAAGATIVLTATATFAAAFAYRNYLS